MTTLVFGAGAHADTLPLRRPLPPIVLELSYAEAEQLLDELPTGELRDAIGGRMVIALSGAVA